MSFGSFWRRNLGCARLAIVSQLEYRFNLFVDAVIQPVLSSGVEVAMWSAIFAGSGLATIAGFAPESYLTYALWAVFMARISANWMYEFRMLNEIETGAVNSILVRPISFYEYYLSQFLGYKVLTALFSLVVPLAISYIFGGTTIYSRLPAALLLVFFYLILVHTLSFTVATLGFFLNRAQSFTMAKNIALWMLSGELFPLDIVPEPFRSLLLNLPFASAVFVPVGYLTGRLEASDLLHGYLTVAIGIAVISIPATLLWNAGRRRYSGTGA